MKRYNYALIEKDRAFLSKEEDKLVLSFQNDIKLGWELSDENIEILENLFKKAIQEGYQFSKIMTEELFQLEVGEAC